MDTEHHNIHIFWSADDDCYIAITPSFPGLSTFGATRMDALKEFEVVLPEFVRLSNK